MRILEIELKGHKRFSLNNIETLKITPRQKFHWVLGTNGSGKTSLLKELSPLPGNPASFHKGGHKKVLIEDKGISYQLISDFSGPKNLFHFIVLTDQGEEELNPGHTSTVFTHLVAQRFGITKEIHELAVGTREFDRLSPNDRKQLLTKISDTDYSFALSYFQKLLSGYRDLLGSIKTDQNRLMEAKTKLISPEEEALLTEDIKLLKSRAHSLMEVCPNPTTPASVVNQRIAMLQQQMAQTSKAFRQRLRKDKHLLPLNDQTTLQDQASRHEVLIKIYEEEGKEASVVLEEITKKIYTLQMVHATDAVTLQSDIQTAIFELKELESKLHSGIQTQQPMVLIETFDGWQRDLEIITHNLTPDTHGVLNQTELQIAAKEYQRGENFLHVCQTRRNEVNRRIEEIRSCDHNEIIECPNCHNRWVPGKSPEDLKIFEAEVETILGKMKAAQQKMMEHKGTIDRCETHLKGLEYLNQFIWTHDQFKPFWEKLLYKEIPKKNPGQILSEVLAFRQDLNTLKSMEDIRNYIADLQNKKELLENQGTVNITTLIETQKVLDNKIQSCYDKRENLLKLLVVCKQKISLIDYVVKATAENKLWQQKSEACFMESFDHYQRERLSDFILATNSEILEKEKRLRSVEIQKAQVEILTANLQDTLEFSKVLKAAVQELSPSEGLIAKGLTGFINHFIGLVNGLIRKVWLYPMELVPVLPDDDNNVDLNYKFSVLVKGELVPDLVECSSGQREIINLAIRIVAMSFLRLDHGPLFLDEFGARMDVAHKASAFDAISNLLATSNFTQIFMISHFEGSYNSSLEADITVLCPANIQLPPGLLYNQQTQIN